METNAENFIVRVDPKCHPAESCQRIGPSPLGSVVLDGDLQRQADTLRKANEHDSTLPSQYQSDNPWYEKAIATIEV